ncbi:pyridoxal phosphate-dependent aminotransferase family protein [Lacihabitans sp. LS3-19]|uniref:aminotransferase class I/II-fold pyridoxal phosphate-dependent enzyme n=1 Tax=Lacihabitans sp. LS3-19 TaxID=2487335 RepID=UPI0020CC58B7|nr:pyridoxal phosphate-dependent aminotransferase family protein [Lacihabitans sp. LS3-19]MCP9769848.1 pyridoxal phosphate-dependent aminotransferase family protein [Lacihabitans sp. LS3-19]
MGVSIFDKISKDMGPLGAISHFGHHYFSYPILEGEIGPHMTFNGRKVLNWSLNNYLGLSNHPEVRKADTEAIEKYGLSYPMGSRMMSANSHNHENFEAQLADFSGNEDAFLMNFGYQGIMSVIEALVDHRDVIVYDGDCHACLIDGIRLHKAKGGAYYRFNHNDMASLDLNLRRATKLSSQNGGGILVITEGVFGMTGQIGKIDEIVELKQKYDFKLLVDDAHGFGVLGENGKGTPEHFGCQNEVDIYFATFTKAMSAMGAFVGADANIIKFLRYNVRSQIYAKALPMGYVIGGMKRLELIKSNPEFRLKLWDIASRLQNGLKAEGFNLETTNSHVTPVYFNKDFTQNEVGNMIIDLRENLNIFCSVVIYPVVNKGVVMLRLIPTSMHTHEEVDYTIEAFKKIRAKLDEGAYNFEIPLKSEIYSN